MKISKYKNTALIFEIITRYIVRETLNENQKPVALQLIRKFFGPTNELSKELRLLNNLTQPTEHDPNTLIEMTLNAYKQLNHDQLKKERFRLIKTIKQQYNDKIFFETRVDNYRELANAYRLLNGIADQDPAGFLDLKKIITETISTNSSKSNRINEIESMIRELDPDERVLTMKMIVERFNRQYQNLNLKQKTLLGKYINEDDRNSKFRNFIYSEVSSLIDTFNRKADGVDQIKRIKLNEIISASQGILNSKAITESHLIALMNMYELEDVL